MEKGTANNIGLVGYHDLVGGRPAFKIAIQVVNQKEERDLYGPPMPWRTKPGVLRDWRRPEVFRKNFPDW